MATDDKPEIFPVRDGVARGKAEENRALFNLGPDRVASFATKIIPAVGGGETRLRTKGGNPEFVTTIPESDSEPPAVIFATPTVIFDGNLKVSDTVVLAAGKATLNFTARGAKVPTFDEYGTTTAGFVEQAGGGGRWVGISKQYFDGGTAVEVNLVDDYYEAHVWSGDTKTQREDYKIHKDRGSYLVSLPSGYRTETPVDNMKYVGSCKISGRRKDYFLEEYTVVPDLPDISGLSLSYEEDVSGTIYHFATPYNMFGAVVYFYSLQKYRIFSYDLGTEVTLPAIPFASDRSYAFCGGTFLAPDKPALVFLSSPGRELNIQTVSANGNGWESTPLGGDSAGNWDLYVSPVGSEITNSYALTLFILDGGSWTAHDISGVIPNIRVDTRPTSENWNVIPLRGDTLIIGPRLSYATTGAYYTNTYSLVDAVTGAVSVVTARNAPLSTLVAMDIFLFEKDSWIESILKWPRVGGTGLYPTAYQWIERLRYTLNGGTNFTDVTSTFQYSTGFELATPLALKPNGDFSGLAFVASTYERYVAPYYIKHNDLRVFTSPDMVHFTASSYPLMTVLGNLPAKLINLGSSEFPANIDIVSPWTRDSSKTPPAYW